MRWLSWIVVMILLQGPTHLLFPFVENFVEEPSCSREGVAHDLGQLFENDPQQRRHDPRCDNNLTRLAQYRATDMVTRQYFNHTDPDGFQANHYLEIFGCRLPNEYPKNGNSIESLGLNYTTPGEMWEAFKHSPAHRRHVLGEIEFFRNQRFYGIGYAENDWGRVYVIVTIDRC